MHEPEPLNMDQFTLLREDMRTLRDDIVERLDKINGNVRRHETEIALLKSTAHPQNSCPIVYDVQYDLQELKAARTADMRVAKFALGIGAAVAAIAQIVVQILFR